MTDARIDQAKGDIKTAAGRVTGDEDLELQGRSESAAAGLRKDAGDAMDRAKDVAGDVAGRARDVAGDVADTASDVARQATDKAKDVLNR